MLAVAGSCQETGEAPGAADLLLDQGLGDGPEGHRLDRHFHLPLLPCQQPTALVGRRGSCRLDQLVEDFPGNG